MIENIFLAVGINLIPILIWLLIISIIAIKFKNLLKKIKSIISYLILSFSLMIIIAPLEFYSGPLSLFTVSGEVPLGGKLGESISNLWSWQLTIIQILITGIALSLIVPNKSIMNFNIHLKKIQTLLNYKNPQIKTKAQIFNENSNPDNSDDSGSNNPELIQQKLNIQNEKQNNNFNQDSQPITKPKYYHSESEAKPPIKWQLPNLNLLDDFEQIGISKENIDKTAQTIKKTLADYNVDVEIGKIQPGPTVTMYGIIPGWIKKYKSGKNNNEIAISDTHEIETKTRVKVDSILSREKDLALALKTPSIRIETPVMGESLIGIEVPNPKPNLVTLRRIMESKPFLNLKSKAQLPVVFGKGSAGETKVNDLSQMPHLLIAGSTGSGKSVFINSLLSCLIMQNTPETLRLLLIDPKRVELTPYNGIPHLISPVLVETDQVVAVLKALIQEMQNRYKKMEELGARNIISYNQQSEHKMPYLLIAVDELADLMMTSSFEIEQALCRLAQLGRATGIHLIIATQRPSVDVITGLIKANFPSRISFSVTSQIDSRTILDSNGAEKLLGKGDMLYLAREGSKPERIQGAFLSDKEIKDIVQSWQSSTWPELENISLTINKIQNNEINEYSTTEKLSEDDDLIQKSIELAQMHKKLSTSLLQRKLRIGYPRAARLMDELETEGIVGPGDGSKPRDVMLKNNEQV
ncbi:MAG: DNA translocase FtsK [SAR202 cluster bacterium]|nr:DNA translocase FtsK [SAR202 cluster bacterium]